MQGLSGKDLELHLSASVHKPDVLCITESWLGSDELSNFYLENYTMASSYCRGHSIRGGCLILVDRKHKTKNRLDIVDMSVERNCEISSTELKSVIIVCIYRPPSGDFNNFMSILEDTLNKITSKSNKHIVVCGDFNVDLNIKTNHTNMLLDLMSCFSLTRSIYTATRTTNTTSTCIDNIFTDLTVHESGLCNFVGSDHDGQLISTNIFVKRSLPKKALIRKRHPNEENVQRVLHSLREDLESIDFDDDPNLLFHRFF